MRSSRRSYWTTAPTEHVDAARRPLPALYAVTDRHGRVIWEGADSHDAWCVLTGRVDAAAKIDASDPTIVYARRMVSRWRADRDVT